MMQVEAVFFDLYGTLVYVEDSVSDERASNLLLEHGHEVYPQAFKAAWQFVSFIDYPRYGYKTWTTYLKRVLQKLGIKPDEQTLTELVELHKSARWRLYPDVTNAVTKAKDVGLKTAIITTIARFKYKRALKPVLNKIDLLVDGHTFHCEKSNPRILLKALEALGIEAAETVMIGDDLRLDILNPKGLGIRTIFLDRRRRFPAKNCKEADAVVMNLNQAMDVIVGWPC